MRIYGFYNEYSGHEIDTALRELTASEYRQLGNIFEDKGINLAKYHKDRENFSSSIILKFFIKNAYGFFKIIIYAPYLK